MLFKVSVIIPVYKAEKDIARCCRALFSQTLDSIEYIFVNDCTPDDSVAVIEQVVEDYPHRKPSVNILHQPKNSGVSACRQLGLDNATGEFVIHCDSDDWPERDMYETLYNTATHENAEVVVCDYVVEYQEEQQYVRFPDAHVQKPSLNTDPVEGAVWNKLISHDLIKRCGAEFYKGINLGEDFGFATPCRVMSMRNVVVHKALYHYNQLNTNSITHNYKKDHFLQMIDLAKKIEKYLQKNGKSTEYEREICYMKYLSKMYFLVFGQVRDIELWKNTFPESNKYIWSYPVPAYLKFTSWLISIGCAGMAKLLLNLKTTISGH